jgi:hypothetical protein
LSQVVCFLPRSQLPTVFILSFCSPISRRG